MAGDVPGRTGEGVTAADTGPTRITAEWNSGTAGSSTSLSTLGAVTDYKTPVGNSFFVQKQSNKLPVKLGFKLVKRKFGILGGHVLDRRVKALWKLAEDLDELGQKAFSEKFLLELEMHLRESEMYAGGFRLFIMEKLLRAFVDKMGRDVYITNLEEFTRLIPADAQKKLKKAQKLQLFDKYHVVHYDPNMENVSEEEKQEVLVKRKDPILFGSISQSDKLYFIADWEDEYCDLRLEDIVDALDLEEEELKLTKAPVLSV